MSARRGVEEPRPCLAFEGHEKLCPGHKSLHDTCENSGFPQVHRDGLDLTGRVYEKVYRRPAEATVY